MGRNSLIFLKKFNEVREIYELTKIEFFGLIHNLAERNEHSLEKIERL